MYVRALRQSGSSRSDTHRENTVPGHAIGVHTNTPRLASVMHPCSHIFAHVPAHYVIMHTCPYKLLLLLKPATQARARMETNISLNSHSTSKCTCTTTPVHRARLHQHDSGARLLRCWERVLDTHMIMRALRR